MANTTSAASDITANRDGTFIVGFEVPAETLGRPGPHGYWIHSEAMTREYAYELGQALMEKAAPPPLVAALEACHTTSVPCGFGSCEVHYGRGGWA